MITLKEAFKYFQNHPSITNIKRKGFDAYFILKDSSSSEVIKLIKNPECKKLIFLLRLLIVNTILKRVNFHP